MILAYLDRHPLLTGLLGTTSSAGSLAFGFMEQANVIIQFFTALIGLAIGILTLMILLRKWRRGSGEDE